MNNNPYIKYYSKLKGKKIKEVVADDSEDTMLDFGEPVFGLLFTDNTVAWIMQDPEGNGPGFLDIQVASVKNDKVK
jgi:hypothetical protein